MPGREFILSRLQPDYNVKLPAKLMPLNREPAGLTQFMEKAQGAGARVHQTESGPALAELVTTILQEEDNRSIYYSSHPMVKATINQIVKADNALWCEAPAMSRTEYRQGIFQADVGLCACDALVAETGTVVLRHHTGNERLLSLAPNHIICLADQKLLIPDLQSLANHIKNQGGESFSALTLITGVSRTADIGLQVVLGMHGPRQVDLIIYRGQA
jgi:L-lactate utilization protein LutC